MQKLLYENNSLKLEGKIFPNILSIEVIKKYRIYVEFCFDKLFESFYLINLELLIGIVTAPTNIITNTGVKCHLGILFYR